MPIVVSILLILVVLGVVAAVVTTAVTRLYRKVPQGQALVHSRARAIDVTFTGALVIPVIHRAEYMEIGVKVIEIEKAGSDGLICKDNIRADIRVSFYVRVNPNADDVRKVAQLVGCENASNQDKLEQLFGAKFSEALKTAGKQLEFVELYDKREQFRSEIINVIGQDLNGYVLDDVAIEYLEQTPVDQLSATNILDAEGIRKITERTTQEQIQANIFRREAEKQIKAKDVETQQAVFEMDRQERSAEIRAQREMATTQARELSLTAQVEAEEKLKAETARLKTEETIQVQTQNVQREVEVASKNRERVVAVENEKVEKARQLEIVAREVETTSARRDLEKEQASIAELAKARIAVEKTVAEQEESIKTLRQVEGANREKEATVIKAGAEAEAGMIATIKQAEADEKASQFKAKERLTVAEATRSAVELEAVAKMRMAEATRAEKAAEGLAQVEVRRAEATAIELTGAAQAKVKEVDAAAERSRGESLAVVARLTGEAEGAATEARLKGEAAGITEKAAAMKELEGVGKDCDLAVRTIDANTQVRLASVEASKDAAIANSTAMGSALAAANIDIVGGTDMFVDRILGAAATGKALESFAESSDATKAITAPYTSGEKDLMELVGSAISGLGAGGVASLSVARLLNNVADRMGGDDGALLRELVTSMKSKGLDQIDVKRLLGS